ncbi:MAG: hypothetical protein LUD83_09110 [Clostridiales bacterium]|nr:hypothetical protein [Clostridiales bacterium]
MARRIDDPCDGCICRYCRWHGSDNCKFGCDGDGSCFTCGERRRQKRPLYQCDGYEPPVLIIKEGKSDGNA